MCPFIISLSQLSAEVERVEMKWKTPRRPTSRGNRYICSSIGLMLIRVQPDSQGETVRLNPVLSYARLIYLPEHMSVTSRYLIPQHTEKGLSG